MKKRIAALTLCLLLALTLWAPAQAASNTEYKAVLEATLENIRNTVTNPMCGSTYGEWAVLALARGGVEDDAWYGKYMDEINAYVDDCGGVLHTKKYTEYSRVVLGLTALGQDAGKLNTGSQVYDLVSPLLDKQTNGEYWATWQGNNGTIFALIALDSQNYLDDAAGTAARAGLLDALLDTQLASGAWEISPGDTSPSTDTTAMALQALAPYYLSSAKFGALNTTHTYAQLQTAVTDALDYLDSRKANDYGSVEAAAQVVVALAALGRDAASDALLGDALGSVLSYYSGNGLFAHDHAGSSADSQMSIEQAAYALVAYDRWKSGKTSLYDMTDRPVAAEIAVTAPASAAVTQTASGVLSVTSDSACAVIAVMADGTYTRLAPEGTGNTRTFHTVQNQVIVRLTGDYDGDGTVKTLDLAKANMALLSQSGVSALETLVMGVENGKTLKTVDLAKLNLKLISGSAIDW